MTGDAARGETKPEDPLFGDAHAVVARPVVLEHWSAALVDEQVTAHLVRVVLAQPARADIAAGLLIGDEHELERTLRGAPALPRHRHRGDGLGRDLRLHVERAASPQEAVGEFARPRIVLPLRRVGEHRVDVAEVDERRARRGAIRRRERRDEVRPPIDGAEQLGLEPGTPAVLGEVLDRRAFVAGRVDGVELDEPLENLGRLALQIDGRGHW